MLRRLIHWTIYPALRPLLRPFLANRVYTIRHGLAKGLKRKGGLGFIPRKCTDEERFLLDLDLRGMTIWDVGGYEGIFSMFFARAAGDAGNVFVFEPHPTNYQRVLDNVALNAFTNVEVRQLAMGAEKGTAVMAFRKDELATSSIQTDIRGQIAAENGAQTIEVEVGTLDDQAAQGLPLPDLVKVDVEGLELDVLKGMTQTMSDAKPRIYIEIHGADFEKRKENVKNVLAFVLDHGYAIQHVETGETIAEATARNAGHLYCT